MRQTNAAVEFRVNGSYIGTMKRDSRAESVTSGMKIENVAFRCEPFPGTFVPIDISPKSRPGAMEGARITLTDKSVPFITADGKSLDLGITAKQSTPGRRAGEPRRNQCFLYLHGPVRAVSACLGALCA